MRSVNLTNVAGATDALSGTAVTNISASVHGLDGAAGGSADGDEEAGCDSPPSPVCAAIPPPGVNTCGEGDGDDEGDGVGDCDCDECALDRCVRSRCETLDLLEHE
jgi:hypothetical protein